MDKPITTRLPREFISGLKKIAEKENVDTSTIIRKFLFNAMKEWKIEHALKMYAKSEFSLGQVAEFAEISIWDVPNLLKERKIPLNYDTEELEADLNTITWKKK